MTRTDDAGNGRPAILFVDDEEKARKYFKMAFAKDFQVLLAASVDEGLAILSERADEIGIVVSDQRMPEKLGVELLREISRAHPEIVRILTTAYSDLESAIDAVNRGEIYRYIAKPWELEPLRADLRRAMELYELRRERNALMAEKLSVQSRLIEISRLQSLCSVAAATGADNVPESLFRFVDDWVARGHTLLLEGDGLSFDLAEETGHLMEIGRRLSITLASTDVPATGILEMDADAGAAEPSEMLMLTQLAVSLGASTSAPARLSRTAAGQWTVTPESLPTPATQAHLLAAVCGHLLARKQGWLPIYSSEKRGLALSRLNDDSAVADDTHWTDRLITRFEPV